MPEILITLGAIILGFCILVALMESPHGRRARQARIDQIISDYKKEHPE